LEKVPGGFELFISDPLAKGDFKNNYFEAQPCE
jgi:hypothetical protein